MRSFVASCRSICRRTTHSSCASAAAGPRNDLQIKFTDASGDNVWWLNRQNFALPRDSTTLRIKQRQIEFAWGPTADRTLRTAAAIEFVVAASLQGGGKGTLCLERLVLQPLPPPPAAPPPMRVHASAGDANAALDGRDDTAWQAPQGRQTLSFDFGATRELNGMLLHWRNGARAVDYDVSASADGRHWRTLKQVRDGDGGIDALFLPELETRYLRLTLLRSRARGYALSHVELPTPAQWPNIDSLFKTLATHAPRGRYPRAYLSEQNYWTLVGVDGGATHSALFSEDGVIEIGRGAPSVEPFVQLADGSVISWADVKIEHRLRDGYLPLPSVRWTHDAFTLDIETAAEGTRDASALLARYTLHNRRDREQRLELRLALRPFQVNPPQQFLSTPGGVSAVRRLEWRDGTLHVNGRAALRPATAPAQVVAKAYGASTRPLTRARRPERAGRSDVDLSDRAAAARHADDRMDGAAGRQRSARRHRHRRAPRRGRRRLARAPEPPATEAAASGATRSTTRCARRWRRSSCRAPARRCNPARARTRAAGSAMAR